MMRFGLILSLLVSTQVPASSLAQAPAGVIDVEGADLQARLAAARTLGAKKGRFWAAYAFPVRPGIAFDAAYIGTGRVIVFGGAAGTAPRDTGHADVFLLFEDAGRAPVRVEISSVRRPRDDGGLPVYWLGQASADQSLAVLRGLVSDVRSQAAAARLVDAIGAHDLSDVAPVLRNIVDTSTLEHARAAAVSWLGSWPGQTDFLAALVRDERERTPVRHEAAESLSRAVDRDVLPLLQQLYRAVTHREIRGELLDGIAGRFEPSATAFLIQVANAEPDRQLRGDALESLGERFDAATLQALERVAYDPDVPQDLQHTAVEAIRERPEHEGVALLEKIVQTHPRAGVRRAAIEELAELPGQLAFLTRLAGDAKQSLDVRLAAIDAIADAETASVAVATLLKLFAAADSSGLKEGLIEAIAETPDPSAAIQVLAGIARGEADRDVRAEAISALGEIEDERAIETLGQLYDSTRDEETRREILEALSEADGAVALQRIISAARADPSMNVRRHAIELLGESDDPAALSFLEGLLR